MDPLVATPSIQDALGDRKAWEELVLAHNGAATRSAAQLGLLGGDQEAAVQLAWLQLYDADPQDVVLPDAIIQSVNAEGQRLLSGSRVPQIDVSTSTDSEMARLTWVDVGDRTTTLPLEYDSFAADAARSAAMPLRSIGAGRILQFADGTARIRLACSGERITGEARADGHPATNAWIVRAGERTALGIDSAGRFESDHVPALPLAVRVDVDGRTWQTGWFLPA